jgi:hypothetical protein
MSNNKVTMPIESAADARTQLNTSIVDIGSYLREVYDSGVRTWIFVDSKFDDYKQARDILKLFYGEKDWSAFTATEKSILAQWHVCTKEQLLGVYNLIDVNALGRAHHVASVRARERRVRMVVSYTLSHFGPLNKVKMVVQDMENLGLIRQYAEFGIEGTIEDGDNGLEGLFDFMESRVGTTYESSGFSSKTTITPIGGGSLGPYVSRIMDILRHGNYPSDD